MLGIKFNTAPVRHFFLIRAKRKPIHRSLILLVRRMYAVTTLYGATTLYAVTTLYVATTLYAVTTLYGVTRQKDPYIVHWVYSLNLLFLAQSRYLLKKCINGALKI